MSLEEPAFIDFEENSKHVSAGIPAAVQQAAGRFAVLRAQRVAELPQWEQLRQIGSDIRLHTIQNMDAYLERFEKAASKAGSIVHWASTAEEARAIVIQVAREHQVDFTIKSKSMATEEIALNRALEENGIQALETDLGEYIIQLAATGPSHILVPAIHLKRDEIAALFNEKLHVDVPPVPEALVGFARNLLRQKFLQAEMSITGANFLIAETGTLVMVTNEGNGRMCATLPDIQVAVVGIDKIIPDWDSLTVFLKLLARSATGQKISTYTQFITGPGRQEGEGGPRELHIILLDNSRTQILQDPVGREVFKCIRCGACANVCPVYQNVGGFAYGWFISGPIGAILTPQMLGTKAAWSLPYASTLCGACAEVCPVKIPIPSILRHLRRRAAEGDEFASPVLAPPLRFTSTLASFSLAHSWLYRLGTRLFPAINPFFRRDGWLKGLPYPLSRWTKVRPLPPFEGTFRRWWSKRQSARREAQP